MQKLSNRDRAKLHEMCVDAVEHHRRGGQMGIGPMVDLIVQHGYEGLSAALDGLGAILYGAATNEVLIRTGKLGEVQFGAEEAGVPSFVVIGPDGEVRDNPDASNTARGAVWALRFVMARQRRDRDTAQALVLQMLENRREVEYLEALLDLAAQAVDSAERAARECDGDR